MTTSTPTLRLLNDPALDGPANMARDEALLTRVGRGESPATLRLYRWDPPTLSLGYFQPYAQSAKLPPPAGALSVVRRMTGGGAILHDLELTYSLTLPLRHPLIGDNPRRLYEVVHDAVMDALAALSVQTTRCGDTDDSTPTRGPFFCFERRHCFDVLLSGDKLAGSAQRRTKDALLQHGSIILGNRFDQQPTARLEGNVETLTQALGEALPAHLARATGFALLPGEWTADELAAAAALLPKYRGAEWTRRA